jgi:periplasmic divalent cation tolerance protein
MTEQCVEIVVTAEDPEWLVGFTRRLVEERLVACGQNIQGVRAIYRWDGEICDDPQARVALHTRESLVPRILERTEQEHADDVPCFIVLPIRDGLPAYLDWIRAATS